MVYQGCFRVDSGMLHGCFRLSCFGTARNKLINNMKGLHKSIPALVPEMFRGWLRRRPFSSSQKIVKLDSSSHDTSARLEDDVMPLRRAEGSLVVEGVVIPVRRHDWNIFRFCHLFSPPCLSFVFFVVLFVHHFFLFVALIKI